MRTNRQDYKQRLEEIRQLAKEVPFYTKIDSSYISKKLLEAIDGLELSMQDSIGEKDD